MSLEIIENEIFGKTSRFQLKQSQENEIFKDFKNSKILICGASGSIGRAFVLRIKKYKIAKIYFLDKDENGLANLCRDINLNYYKAIKKEYLCQDINSFNLNNFLKKKKISHFLNFAALKHVRSEENSFSLNYLIHTNSISPFNLGNLKTLKSLKKIFFISTDKAAYPSSIMGCSKKIMEDELYKIKKKFNNKFVSTVRFANVAFSNGSLLKNIYDRTITNEPIGIPSNIKRYFVTHKEAADLCLLSLLKESDGNIVLPSYKSLGKMHNLENLAEKIIKLMGKKIKYRNKRVKVKNNQQLVILETRQIIGQKEIEVFYEKGEHAKKFSSDDRLMRINLHKNHRIHNLKNLIKNQKDVSKIKEILSKTYNSYRVTYSLNNRIMLKDII